MILSWINAPRVLVSKEFGLLTRAYDRGGDRTLAMKTIRGIVEGGVVKLPPGAQLAEGAQVVVTVIEPITSELMLPLELEDEDVAFARACRGRLNQELRSESEDG